MYFLRIHDWGCDYVLRCPSRRQLPNATLLYLALGPEIKTDEVVLYIISWTTFFIEHMNYVFIYLYFI